MTETIVSLSGGKDSTAMLFQMLERGERVDEVLFFDTGMEFPQMYEHIALVEQKSGIPITRLTYKESFMHGLLEHERTRGKRMGQRGFGWPTHSARWCTAMKARAIDAHTRGRDYVSCVGIAADEQKRCKDGIRYPLIEYGMTEADCLAYCRSLGFTWGGLYDHFKRVSCWCCPLQSLDELRVLRTYHPDLWDELMMMDNAVQRCGLSQLKFRNDYDLPEIEMRFRREERQMRLI